MKISELDFPYPEQLVATAPQYPPRVMMVRNGIPSEIQFSQLKNLFKRNDILIINETKVLKRRVFAGDLEVLFLRQIDSLSWEVLFPAKTYPVETEFNLPGQIKMILKSKGLPQLVELSQAVAEEYFDKYGELPLPPYIQKARHTRKNVAEDSQWYQTPWAAVPGSLAAPTASLHFKTSDLEELKDLGVKILPVVLHVGIGTFLPIKTPTLKEHKMHSEFVTIPRKTAEAIEQLQFRGPGSTEKVWALGTTSVRAVESFVRGYLKPMSSGDFFGETDLFLSPETEVFHCVDNLLTNFHQPKSSLLALVATHSGLDTVQECYQWAVQNQFRLFSYGDLSIWLK